MKRIEKVAIQAYKDGLIDILESITIIAIFQNATINEEFATKYGTSIADTFKSLTGE